MSKTEENLKEAFAGESQANRKYLAFAQRAADEGMEGVAKLFFAVAEAETIHAHKHLAHLGGIGTTEENLNEAIGRELHEFKNMYPEMIKDTREEGAKAAEITLAYAMEVEKVHHKLFTEALANKDDFPSKTYYICKACGYTVADDLPDKCPVCGADKKAFNKIYAGKEKNMERQWSYNDYKVEEGLKPGSKHFQYFFNVYRGRVKKCNYCVWIEDEALSRFHQYGNFDEIISSHKEAWIKWVREKIDAGDLNDKVLKFGNKGQEEIDLPEMRAHLSMD